MGHDPTAPQAPTAAQVPLAPHVPGLRLDRALGRGAHGEVWAAVDLGSGEQVAVKLRRTAVPPGRGAVSGGRSPVVATEAAERLACEIALLRRIDHPHVVRLRRVLDLADGSRAMVLDHAAGGSLAELVRARGPLRPAEVVTLLVALARALADLHAGGVVHGDLAPGNVLFTQDGRPLLSDLGLGSVLGVDPRSATWATPGFDDPAGLPAGDPARDVWGLGAVAWFALTGRPPADMLVDDLDQVGGGGPSPASAGSAAHAGSDPNRPAPNRAVPVGEVLRAKAAVRRAALFRLLRDCLAEEPARRPPAVEVARQAWWAVPPAPIRLTAREPLSHVRQPSDSSALLDRSATAPVPGVTQVPGPWSVPRTTAPRPDDDPDDDPDGDPDDDPDGDPDDDSGRDPFFDITRRVREQAARPDGGVPARSAGPWWLRSRGRLPNRRPSVLLAGVVTVAALGAAVFQTRVWMPWSAGLRPGSGATASSGPAPSGPVISGGAWSGLGAVADASSGAAFCAPALPSAGELASAVCELARGRAAAFATASTAPLALADEPGSAAMAADTGLVRRLQERGLRLQGVFFAVTQVRLVARASGSVTVAASVATSGHRQVRTDGTVVAQIPATASRPVQLVLVRSSVAAGWRVRSLTK
jgi:serine/threonine protein kinase